MKKICKEYELVCVYLCANYPAIVFCGYDGGDDCCDDNADGADTGIDDCNK